MLQTLLTRSRGARAETPTPVPESGEGLPAPRTGAGRSDFCWFGVLAAFSRPCLASLKMCFCFKLEQGPEGL